MKHLDPRTTLAAVVAAALLLPAGLRAAGNWEADAFMFLGEPDGIPTTAAAASNSGKGVERIDTPVAEVREDQLGRFAAVYQAENLRSPVLDPIGTHANGSKVYGVFYFGFAGSGMNRHRDSGGLYMPIPNQSRSAGCRPIRSGFLAINADKDLADEGRHLTLSHELFHAVQAAYPFRQGCMLYYWLNEGMAKGVEQWMYARDHNGTEPGEVWGNRGSQGLRPYHVPLHYEPALKRPDGSHVTYPYEVTGNMTITRKQIGYGTASFWRFLIDVAGGLEFLGEMMEAPISDDSAEGRLAWVDDGFGRTNAFGNDRLYALYPEFVTEFASWGGTRYTKIAYKKDAVGEFGSNREEARDVWLRLAFDNCSEVEIGPGETKPVPLDLERVAARCIEVTYTGVEVETTPVVEAVHDVSDALDSLHLGVAWETGPDRDFNCWKEGETYEPGEPRCILKVQQLKSSEGRWARDWNDGPVQPGDDTTRLYVLSNVQKNEPWYTPIIEDLTFRVGLPVTETASGETGGPPDGTALKEDEKMKALAEKSAAGAEISTAEAMEAASEMMQQVMSGMTDEALYGATGGIGLPIAAVELASFSFALPDGRRVTLQPMPNEDGSQNAFGDTGPLLGALTLESSPSRIDSSTLCESNRARVGSITESTEDRLVIRIAADICRMDTARPMACADGCPQVDRVDATIKLPAGWRYYSSSAPEPVVTEGIRDYIRRFDDVVPGPSTTPRPAPPLPQPSDDSDSGEDGATGLAREDDASDDGEEPQFDCACTCAEYDELIAAAEEATATMPPDLDVLERVDACIGQCFEQYGACQRGR